MRGQPALSTSVVALAFTQDLRPRTSRSLAQTRLVLLDRTTGMPRDSRDLDEDLGSVSDLELGMLGDALLIGGRRQITILESDR
jgi:hypothetical protein